MKELEVIAGIIRFPFGRYLIGQRPPHKNFGRLWEFPGGQLEGGEMHEQCLYREIEEEFPRMRIYIGKKFGESRYEGADLKIHLIAYNADYISGVVKSKAHTQVALLFPWEMKKYIFAPADVPFITELMTA